MAFHDMRVNYDLIARDEIKGPTRLWLVRLMVAQIREATVVVAPLTRTPILTLEDCLEPFEDDHPEDVREAREAAAELKSVIQAPWAAGGTVWKEFTRIRNGVYHYGHNADGREAACRRDGNGSRAARLDRPI